MSSSSAVRTLSHQGQQSDLIELEHTDRASYSSSQIIQRDLEAGRAQVQEIRRQLIEIIRRQLAIQERLRRAVADRLETLAARIEADRETIDCIYRHIKGLMQDIEQWARAGIHVYGEQYERNWEIQHSLDQLPHLEERLALNRQHQEDEIARMAQSWDDTERYRQDLRQNLRQELRDAQGEGVDEEEAHEAVVLDEQF